MKEPVKGMKWAKYPVGDVTQWFSENPVLYGKMNMKGHNGIDIVRPWGEHLFAVEGGKVTESQDHPDGYGEYVRIVSPIGREWSYGHMSFRAVKVGDMVREGQYIGNIGNTGFVVSNQSANGYWDYNPYRGTHLHLGVRDRVDGKVKNYKNGYYGSYNPLPLFRDPTLLSSKIISIASATADKVVFQFGQLLRNIGM